MIKKYQNLTKADYDAIADPSWPIFDDFCCHKDVPTHIYDEIDQMLNLQKFDHPSFCILPFYGIEYPNGQFCCLTPPGSDRNQVQKKILSRERSSECSACWKLEDRGLRSDRLIKNETFDFYHGISTRDLYQQLETYPLTQLVCVKFDSDNTCNSTCVTCGPRDSTAWGNLLQTKKHLKTWHIKQQEFDYAQCKTIMFRGGEPFLSKHNFDILKKMLDLGNTSCVVSFVTNGSIWPTKEQLTTMLKFKNLIISFSIDGVGPVFEYLRYPLKWSTTVTNLQRWQDMGVEVGVNYTLSNLNVCYHDQTRQWFQDYRLPVLTNPVIFPEWFAINSLPEETKKTIKDILKDNTVQQLFCDHQPIDDTRFQQCRGELLKQDSLKNISIKEYLPEFAALVKL